MTTMGLIEYIVFILFCVYMLVMLGVAIYAVLKKYKIDF